MELHLTQNHLLQKHGILTQFSINKFITETEISEMKKEIPKEVKDKNKINQLLVDKIRDNILNDTIPGTSEKLNKQFKEKVAKPVSENSSFLDNVGLDKKTLLLNLTLHNMLFALSNFSQEEAVNLLCSCLEIVDPENFGEDDVEEDDQIVE